MPDSFMKDAYLILKTAPENLQPFLASSLPDFSQSSLLLYTSILFLILKITIE